MSSNVIDIIERFQARHARQEERETQNSHASTNGAVALGMPDENGRSKTGIVEMEEVRVWTSPSQAARNGHRHPMAGIEWL